MKSPLKIGIAVAAVVAVVLIIVLALFLNDPDKTSDDAASNGDSTSENAADENPATTAPTEAPKTLKPEASLTEPQDITSGGGVRITAIESVTSKAKIPGETSGPAIRVTIKVTAGEEPVDLGRIVVNAYYGKDLVPAIAVSGPGVESFTGMLKAGKSFEGVQVFNVPRAERDNVTIEFGYGDSPKPLKFQGSVS